MIDFKALLAATGAPRCSIAEMTPTTSRLVISWTLLPVQGVPISRRSRREISPKESLRNEAFQQILDAVCYGSPPRLPLLGRRIASLELRNEYRLRCRPRLIKGDASIWPDRVLAQLRSRTAGGTQ